MIRTTTNTITTLLSSFIPQNGERIRNRTHAIAVGALALVANYDPYIAGQLGATYAIGAYVWDQLAIARDAPAVAIAPAAPLPIAPRLPAPAAAAIAPAAPLPIAPRIPAPAAAAAGPAEQLAPAGEADPQMQRAVLESLRDRRDFHEVKGERPDRDLDEALRESLRIRPPEREAYPSAAAGPAEPPRKERICAIQRILNGKNENEPVTEDERIPPEFYCSIGKQDYHRGNFVLTLLTGVEPYKNIFRIPVELNDLIVCADAMMIDPQQFLGVWDLASDSRSPIQDADPDAQAAKRTTYRMFLLRKLLSVKTGEPMIDRQREKYLAFFNTQEVWRNIPPRVDQI